MNNIFKIIHKQPILDSTFEYEVDNVLTAKVVMDALAKLEAHKEGYDISIVQVLQVCWDDGSKEWVDYNPSEYLNTWAEDINDLTLEEVKDLVYPI